MKIPHNYKPRDYQLEFLKSNKRFKVAVIHRRGGKSMTALNEQIIDCLTKKGIYYYFLPTYRQAKQVVWDELIKTHIPDEVIQKRNESELTIYYKNGSIQRFAGSEDVNKHRGINPIGVVFDEYAEMKEELWTAVIQPILRENNGRATFIFTPRGKNFAWKLFQQAKDNHQWFTMLRTVKDTQAISQEELQEARVIMPDDLYNQEFNCSFIDDAGSFFKRVQENIYQNTDHQEIESKNFQIGVDLAKFRDWTVLTPFCLNTFYVYPQERFNQIDYNLQKAKIEAFHHKYNKAKVIIDSTGVGSPVFDDLSQKIPNIDPFNFTSKSRDQLLRNLQILLAQDKIKIPNDEGLITELESMRYVLTVQGRTKIEVPDGLTDDRIMSLGLAVWGVTGPQPLDNQKVYQSAQDEYIGYLKGQGQGWKPDFIIK